jgi:signal transduction histidine kinase
MRAVVALADGASDEGRVRAIADGARQIAGAPAAAMLYSGDRSTGVDDADEPVFALREGSPEIRRLFFHALGRFAVPGAFYVPAAQARALAGVAARAPKHGLLFVHIESEERILGTIAIACDALDDERLGAMRAYADAVARLIAARREVSQSQRESRDSRVLALVDERIRRAVDSDDLLFTIAEAVCEGFSAERCAIFERSAADANRARTLAVAGSGTRALPSVVTLRMEPDSIARALGVRRALAVPLARDGRSEQILAVGFSDDALDESAAAALRSVAAHVGLALANTLLYERERDRRSRAEALERIVRVLRDTQSLEEVLLVFVIAVTHELPIDCAAYERDGGDFVRRAVRMRAHGVPEPAVRIDAGSLVPFLESDEPTDASVLPRALRERVLAGRAGVVVPLHVEGSPWGALAFPVDSSVGSWQPEERTTFFRTLGSHLELALANARAFDREQHRAQERATLAEAARTILSFTTLRPLADAMCRLAANLVGAPRACAVRTEADGFVPIGVFGANGEDLADRFASRRRSRAISEDRIAGDRRRLRVAEGEGHVAIPLARTSGETGEPEAVEAYLIVETPGERFGRDALRLLQELGALFALALRNLDLYEETARANAALRESSEFKDDLIAMLAHDFKGPLTVVLGYCELLLETSDESHDEVEMIFAQTQRLVRLSEDALVLAQTQADGFSLDRATVDFGAFVRDCVAAIGTLVARIHLSVPDEALWVSIDPQRFRHVIENLLSNALKYSDAEVRVTVRRASDRAVLEVADLGIGIPSDEMTSVFTRFVRATNARSKGVAGTGLGLYVSRKIVDVHRGTIAVDSKLDQGSTFTVALPLAGAPTSVGA